MAHEHYKLCIFRSTCLWYTDRTHSAGHVLSAHAHKLESISSRRRLSCLHRVDTGALAQIMDQCRPSSVCCHLLAQKVINKHIHADQCCSCSSQIDVGAARGMCSGELYLNLLFIWPIPLTACENSGFICVGGNGNNSRLSVDGVLMRSSAPKRRWNTYITLFQNSLFVHPLHVTIQCTEG